MLESYVEDRTFAMEVPANQDADVSYPRSKLDLRGVLIKMKSRLIVLALTSCLILSAFSASAQVLVGYQQRFFEKYGDGSTGPDSFPCCTAMGTFDQRTTGQNMGAYLAEFKIRTATSMRLGGAGPKWYGFYRPLTGGVTLKQGRFVTDASQMLLSPGGNLRRLTTTVMRTMMDLVMRPNNGPGTLMYKGAQHIPGIPTFRTTMTWLGPYAQMAGQLNITPGPNRFGGTRNILHVQNSFGVDKGTNPNFWVKFVFPVNNGGLGNFVTTMMQIRRNTEPADYQLITIPSPMAFTGVPFFTGPGTGWFSIAPYTTGMIQALARTIGTPIMDFTTRTDTGFIRHATAMGFQPGFVVTGMGGITGQLQLVSGHLLQSRGGSNTSLTGTNVTRITFTPEPASAAMLGAGALGLLGLIVRDRRRHQI
jgi:hypothetical protein